MKYSIFFAAAVAAYDPYGAQPSSSAPAKISSAPSYDNYGGKPSSSAPAYGGSVTSVKNSVPASKATPCSTVVGSNGYTTIVPGYGKPPVTVTQQHQSYPTCVAKGYDGKSCDKWEDDKYVSTVVTDYNKKVVTITKVQDYVTVYQEKKTITHSATPAVGGYGATPTGTSGSKNGTGVWYELYEKVVVCQYAECGKNVLVGYTGSGLCQKCDDEQPVTQKEYKGGKWTEEKKTMNYGKPKDEVKVYEKPGVYTVPAKVVTVYKSEATGSGKSSYDAGIYHIPAKVITITKSNQAYTCTYELPKKTPTKGDDKPATKTPTKGDDKPMTKTPTNNDYGYKVSPTPTPNKPSNGYPGTPIYHKSNTTSTPCDDDKKKSSATPVTVSKPGNNYGASSIPTPPACYGDNCKPTSSTPSKPTSTPCDDDKKKIPTPTPVYNDSNKSNNGANYGDAAKPTPTPVYNDSNKSNNGGDGKTNISNNGGNYGNTDKSNTNANGGNYGDVPGAKSTPPAKAAYGKRSGLLARRIAAVAAQ